MTILIRLIYINTPVQQHLYYRCLLFNHSTRSYCLSPTGNTAKIGTVRQQYLNHCYILAFIKQHETIFKSTDLIKLTTVICSERV